MCVIEVKTNTGSNGRQSIKEKVRRCHEGKRRGSLCDHVERRSNLPATISTSSSSRHSSSADIVTLDKDGRQHRYQKVSTNGKRSSLGTNSSNTRPSSDTTPPRSSPSFREVRPSTSHEDRPCRRSTKYSYATSSSPNRTVGPDGPAFYAQPPHLEMSTAGGAEVSPTQPPSRRQRPAPIIVDTGASMTSTTPSLKAVSPGLSNLPRFGQDSANGLPLGGSAGNYQARVDSLADDDEFEIHSPQQDNERLASVERERLAASERYQQERISREIDARELEQARLERDRMAEADRRQNARVNRRLEAEQAQMERDRLAESDRRQKERQAKARAEDLERQERANIEGDRLHRVRLSQQAEAQARARAEEAQRERHRQDARAALERAEENAEYQRRVDAEYAQVLRERSAADAYDSAANTSQYYAPRSMPNSPLGITYGSVPASPISARQMTTSYVTTSPTSARQPVTVHNHYSSIQNDSLRERGDAVIARAQAEAAQNATERLNSSMARMDVRDDEMDVGPRRSSSRRQTGDVRERERLRVRRYERHYY